MNSALQPTSDAAQTAAALLALPWRFEVVMDAESDEAFRLLTQGRRAEKAVSDYWMLLTPFYLSLALGVYGCLEASMFVSAIFIVLSGVMLLRMHLAECKLSRFSGVTAAPPLKVTVLVTDDGMTEFDRGVESRFEWSAMNRWFLVRGTLFIELTNSKWAIIPAKNMAPGDVSLARLTSFLKIKGVAGKELQL